VQYTVSPRNGTRNDVLKEYAAYGQKVSDITFEYFFDERQKVADIIAKHNLDELVQGKTDVETAIALMNWLCSNYTHGNPPGGLRGATPQALMENADNWGGRTNCFGFALLLSQMLRAYGIKAFHAHCLPYEEPFDDCHVIVSAYCPSLGKNILLDPSDNLYLRNKAGEIISVEELRNIIIANEEFTANPDNSLYPDTLEDYRDYMAKNLIRIQRSPVNGYGICPDSDERITLLPEKYMQEYAHHFSEKEQQGFVTSKEYFWQV